MSQTDFSSPYFLSLWQLIYLLEKLPLDLKEPKKILHILFKIITQIFGFNIKSLMTP